MKTDNEILQEYMFHFNPYKKMWAGFTRDAKNDYFNGVANDKIIFNENIQTIIKFIQNENSKR
jgi:hypothetical protein